MPTCLKFYSAALILTCSIIINFGEKAMAAQTNKMGDVNNDGIVTQGQVGNNYLVLEQRPWIKIESIQNPYIKIESENTNIGVTFLLKNYGGNVANGVRIYTEFHVMTNALFQELLQRQKAVCERGRTYAERDKDNPGGISIFPGDVRQLSFSQPVPTHEVFQKGPDFDHGVSFVLFGCIDYQHPSQNLYGQTSILYFISKLGPGGLPYGIHPRIGMGETELIVSDAPFGNFAK